MVWTCDENRGSLEARSRRIKGIYEKRFIDGVEEDVKILEIGDESA